MQITKSQDKVINSLIEQYNNKDRQIIDFSAPTGSGKTFMSANFISRIFASQINDRNQNTMFVIATVSNAELPKAFARKLEEYKQYLPFKDFDIEFRESPSNSKSVKVEHIKGFELENNKVLVFGTSSFGKKKLFTEMGLLDSFVTEAKEKNWNIIYIRDEAHKGGATNRETSETFYKRFDDKMVDLANFAIQMTATPKGQNDLIELKEEDLVNDGVYLLKTKSVYNDFQRNTSTSDDLIRASLDKFLEIQKEYKKLDNFIRPALLIQVDSKSKNITQEEYDKTINKIIHIVSKGYKLNYLKYFSSDIEGNAKEDLTLESASKHDSNYDVIIFKVGPATGWDIPRACMLLQIREVSSESLNIQTIGRIKRNPIKGLAFNDITNKYYVYSNYQESQRELASYKLKNKFSNFRLYKGNLTLSDKSEYLIEKKYHNDLLDFFKKSAILDFLTENSEKAQLPIEERKYNNKNSTNNIYSIEASSIFQLKIWIDSQIRNNNKYFTDGLNEIIHKLQCDTNISKEIIKYTILKEYLTDIKLIYSKAYEKHRENELYQLVPNQKLLRNYQMWKSANKSNNFDISNLENYGYAQIKSINSSSLKDIQFLDSQPETIFMTKILEEIDEEDYSSKIDFFAKMPTLTSDIFFEYLKTEDSEKHKAFIDFALVSNENILMVEVKGWNDYDEDKTNDLLHAFSKYKEQNENSKVNLLVCYSGKFNGSIKKPEVQFLEEGEIKSISIRKMLRLFFH